MPSFNVWDRPWIEVETGDAVLRLCLRDLLLQAQDLIALADHSPAVMVGIHRLLVAILQDILRPGSLEEIADLWLAGRFPVEKIEAFGEAYYDRFDLFSKDAPFLQTSDVAETAEEQAILTKRQSKKLWPKPVSYMAYEIPSGAATNHFRHTWEKDVIFCPACCAAGLPAMTPFAYGGGQGFWLPGVNPSAYFVLPIGDNLFQSLVLSLIPVDRYPDPDAPDTTFWRRPKPVVIENGKVVNEFGYLQGLTFPFRRIHLFPEEVNGCCARCGEAIDVGVRWMIFSGGERRTLTTPWPDPFVGFTMKDNKLKPVLVNPAKAFWRDGLPLLVGRSNKERQRPAVLDTLSGLQFELGIDLPVLRIRCLGLLFDRGKFLGWHDNGLEVPPALLADPMAEDLVRHVLEMAESAGKMVFGAVCEAVKETPYAPGKKNAPAYQASDEYWRSLADPFRMLVLAYDEKPDVEKLLLDWRRQVKRGAAAAVLRQVESYGDTAEGIRAKVIARHEISRRLIHLK